MLKAKNLYGVGYCKEKGKAIPVNVGRKLDIKAEDRLLVIKRGETSEKYTCKNCKHYKPIDEEGLFWA